MITNPFQYKRANSVDDALEALSGDAKILAGGHSLLPAMKLRLFSADTLVDISKIESLKGIQADGETIIIGAGTTHQAIADSEVVQEYIPLFAQVAGKIGDVQVRNVGTIGGSLAHADPAADWPAALLACHATVVLQSSSGTREIPSEEFFTGMFSTALADSELITQIKVPSHKGYTCRYEKFVQPASRFALVGCAICIKQDAGTISEATVAFTGLADTPFVDKGASAALQGGVLNQESIQAAMDARDQSVYVMSDHFASESYRNHLAGVMLERALQGAA